MLSIEVSPEDFKDTTDDKPSTDPTEKPAEKAEGTPDEKPPEKLEEIPAEKLAEKPAEKSAEKTADAPSVDLDGAAEEFIKSGEITEATLEALKAKGFTKSQVTTYAAGIKAQAAQAQSKIADAVGGQETLTKMLDWAKQGGMDAATGKAYNAMMTSGDEAQMLLAVDGLAARYARAVGTTPERVNGTSVGSKAIAPFASMAEVVEAMSNPKYAKDPAYRKAVEARLAESNV